MTVVALPITAVVVLKATPMEAGILGALDTLPFLLFGLAVGVILDRRTRRPVLIGADVVRAIALSWIPIAYFLGVLTIVQLFLVAFVVGSMTVFFDLAYQSYLPNLISREKLVEANGKMQVSESLAEVASPGAAGVLIGVLGAPYLLAVDAISYVISGVAILKLPADAPPSSPGGPGQGAVRSVWASVREGFAVVGRHPLLRCCTTAAVVLNLFGSALMAVFFLFLIRVAGMGSADVGLVVAVGSAGALCGGLTVDWLTRVLGVGPALIGSMALPGVGYLILVTVHGRSFWAVGTAAAAYFIALFGLPVFNVTVISVRQMATPDHLLGRANATVRTCTWGAFSLGFLLGGVLGSTLGLRETIVVAAGGGFFAAAILLVSPVRGVRQLDHVNVMEAVIDVPYTQLPGMTD
jgi:MFS family permease